MNTTERFDESKLPKHCLNAKGLILDELKRPAPAEFREMYKEGRSVRWSSRRGLSRQVAARALPAENAAHAAPAAGADAAGAASADAAHAVADDVHASAAGAVEHADARAAAEHVHSYAAAADRHADATDADVLWKLRGGDAYLR